MKVILYVEILTDSLAKIFWQILYPSPLLPFILATSPLPSAQSRNPPYYTTPSPSPNHYSSKNSLIASLTSSAFSNIKKCPDSISCTLKSGAYGLVEPSAKPGVPIGSLDAVMSRAGRVRLKAEGGIAVCGV